MKAAKLKGNFSSKVKLQQNEHEKKKYFKNQVLPHYTFELCDHFKLASTKLVTLFVQAIVAIQQLQQGFI
jgi:hypothetical protein